MTVRWRAPGRVNLIGEHTDYNAGLCLPFAIEQGCAASVSLADRFEATSVQAGSVVVDDLADVPAGWARYALGPAKVLADRGVDVPPLRVHLDSDVPLGAGLSSSAAVVCSVTTALDDLLGLGLSPDELLAVARAAENDVVGAPTGGLDQMASLRCTAGHVLLCDFDSLETALVPFDPAGHGLAVLVVDTRVAHGHSDGEYAARRAACEAAAAALGLASLRAATLAQLAALPADLLPLARHVVTENARVSDVVGLLREGRVEEIGPLLSASHASLRDDFRVTVPQLDLAAATLEEAGALGARMTGGGFGGCVIALIPVAWVDRAVAAVRGAFGAASYDEPGWFLARPSSGAHRA